MQLKLLAVFLIPSCLLAQQASHSKSRAKHSPQPPKVAAARPLEGLNPKADWLGADFTPADFDSLFSSKSVAAKGEFETTEQYRSRLERVASNDFYAIAFDGHLTASYDADHQVFKVYLHSQDLTSEAVVSLRRFGQKPVLVVKEEGKVTGEYRGSNAFGVLTTVGQQSAVDDALILNFPLTKDRVMEIYVPVPIEKARAISLGYLLVFKPVMGEAGITTTSSHFDSATLDNPYEVSTTYKYIFAGKTFFWAYDKKTGNVVAKVQLGADAPLLYPGAEIASLEWDPVSGKREVKSVASASYEPVQAFYEQVLSKSGLSLAPVSIEGKSRTLMGISEDKKHEIRITLISAGEVTRIFYLETGVVE